MYSVTRSMVERERDGIGVLSANPMLCNGQGGREGREGERGGREGRQRYIVTFL